MLHNRDSAEQHWDSCEASVDCAVRLQCRKSFGCQTSLVAAFAWTPNRCVNLGCYGLTYPMKRVCSASTTTRVVSSSQLAYCDVSLV